ncbi:hypothetical protein PhCBS80983_g02989 [Powellomyces hirtus]|uniref:Uncharacterized protein n=1 Tax=Powellomyces hirtus TaxID=109895 RepID=A0A507E6H7_9FUNG|nr:hypothetical protein PhCBS80983_g02989 [Powellomyces hirtus]
MLNGILTPESATFKTNRPETVKVLEIPTSPDDPTIKLLAAFGVPKRRLPPTLRMIWSPTASQDTRNIIQRDGVLREDLLKVETRVAAFFVQVFKVAMSAPIKPFTYAPELDPLDWDQSVSAIQNERWEEFSRQEQVLKNYIKWRDEVLETYVTAAGNIPLLRPSNGPAPLAMKAARPELKACAHIDQLKVEIFGYEASTDESSGKIYARSPADPSQIRDKVLRTNVYPYYTKPPGQITHSVLWYRDEMTADEISALLLERLPGDQFVFWINPPHRRTIPEINHCHVLYRKTAAQAQIISKDR